MHAVCALYVGTLESRGTANLGSGDDRIYPLGRVPTDGLCSKTDSSVIALLANANEAEPTEDPLTVTDITDSIRLLVSITDVEEFADTSYTFGLAVVNCFST